MFSQKMFLKVSQISRENTSGFFLIKSLFNKVAVLRACNFVKKVLLKYFPVKFAFKFLRTTICEIFKNNLKNISERLLLNFFLKVH